jgi:hypothetical protein
VSPSSARCRYRPAAPRSLTARCRVGRHREASMSSAVGPGYDWLPALRGVVGGPARTSCCPPRRTRTRSDVRRHLGQRIVAQVAVKVPPRGIVGSGRGRGRMLVALRRLARTRARTVPRYIESSSRRWTVLVSTALPGTPMSVAYHHWLHTAGRRWSAATWTEPRGCVTSRRRPPDPPPADVGGGRADQWPAGGREPRSRGCARAAAVAHEHLSPHAALTSACTA